MVTFRGGPRASGSERVGFAVELGSGGPEEARAGGEVEVEHEAMSGRSPALGGSEAPARGGAAPRPGSWRVLAAYVGVVAVSHVLWISFASITTQAGRTFHASDVSIGLLISVGPICSAVFSIPAGALPDRFGYRIPILWAGLVTVVFAFVRSAAPSFPVLLLLTIGLLVPQPFLINAIADLVNRHFPDEQAATATGLGTMAIFLGITVGVAATPSLVGSFGVRGTQLVYAGASVVALAAFWLIVPRTVPERLASSVELSVRRALSRVVRSRTLWKLSALIFLGFGFYLGMTTWLEEILKPRGIGESAAGLVAGTITMAGMVGSVALGALSDSIRRRKPFLVMAAVVSVPTLWLLGHLGSVALLVVVAAVMGLFLLAALPVAIAVISEDGSLGQEVASTGVGVMLMAGNVGGAVVVALMGILKNVQHSFSAGVVMVTALAAVAIVLSLTIPEPLGGRRPRRPSGA